jgi:hypothetical protein
LPNQPFHFQAILILPEVPLTDRKYEGFINGSKL